MTREQQMKVAIAIIKPSDRAACEDLLTMALDNIERDRSQQQHTKDMWSKDARKKLVIYLAALKRAKAAHAALSEGMRQSLEMWDGTRRETANARCFDALIADCDLLLAMHAHSTRLDLVKLSAVGWAHGALAGSGVNPAMKRKGKWQMLAAVLFGDPGADLYHHCSVWRGLDRTGV